MINRLLLLDAFAHAVDLEMLFVACVGTQGIHVIRIGRFICGG